MQLSLLTLFLVNINVSALVTSSMAVYPMVTIMLIKYGEHMAIVCTATVVLQLDNCVEGACAGSMASHLGVTPWSPFCASSMVSTRGIMCMRLYYSWMVMLGEHAWQRSPMVTIMLIKYGEHKTTVVTQLCRISR